ncbi:MAG: putative zinc-binding metallopeptidase [Acidobacteriota bacterium]
MTRRAGRSRRRRPSWAGADTKTLLGLRLCDLGVSLAGTPVQARIERIHEELARRRLLFKPHFWVSDEWFCPAGVPGVAVPFYLTHPRLVRLERAMMLEAEGSSHRECMRILRHEVGHALDHAFHLSRRRDWRRHFGKSSKRYPVTYRPKPSSRKYVQHLAAWYAQAHPDEDFAETFAVWLTPRSNWRKRYDKWPALKKLLYVDALMEEIAGRRPPTMNRRRVDAISGIKLTLRGHYERKQKFYSKDYPDLYDRALLRLFSLAAEHRGRERASSFVRRIAPELRRRVAYWTGESQYTLDQVLTEIIGRCQELDLRVVGDRRKVKTDLGIVLTMYMMTFLHTTPRRVTL